MKKFFLLGIFVLLLIFPAQAFAESTYVLPYPSVMPGGVSYKLHVLYERIQKFWYFGDLGQYSYNLKEADKYLVEAKTLFDYKQYLLGYKALLESDQFFTNISKNLISAKADGKKIDSKKKELLSACAKHVEVLMDLSEKVPQEFVWKPEKSNSTALNLHLIIQNSILVREKVCSSI